MISDDRTMIYAPVSCNVEAGSTSPEHPNAIVLGSGATEMLAATSGTTPNDAPEAPKQEIGTLALSTEKVEKMSKDLESNPPRPFDLSRKLTVFTSEVQYAEVKLTNSLFSARNIKLPSDFQKIADEKLRENIKASLKILVDPKSGFKVSHNGKDRVVSEAYLKRERAALEIVFLYDWKGRGKVIFRTERDKFKAKLDDFMALTKAFQDAEKADLDVRRTAFCDQMSTEFLPHWRENPPAPLRHHDKTDEASLTADIVGRAVNMFNEAIEMGVPEAKIVSLGVV